MPSSSSSSDENRPPGRPNLSESEAEDAPEDEHLRKIVGTFKPIKRLDFDFEDEDKDSTEIWLMAKANGEQIVKKAIECKKFKESEIKMMRLVSGHKRVVDYLGFVRAPTPRERHCIFLGLCRTDLFNYQDELLNRKETMSECKIRCLFGQIVDGMVHLHGLNICHRDLKPENIFMTDENNIRIGDFGHAFRFKIGSRYRGRAGTWEYLAPEILEGRSYNHKIDIWMLGVLLFTLFSYVNPFATEVPEKADDKTRREIVKKAILSKRFGIHEKGQKPPALAWSLIKGLLRRNDANRPPITLVKKHRWFQEKQME